MLKEIITAIPPLLVTGISWKAWGFKKSLSSKAPPFILCENLLASKKIKKLAKAKIDKKLATLDGRNNAKNRIIFNHNIIGRTLFFGMLGTK